MKLHLYFLFGTLTLAAHVKGAVANDPIGPDSEVPPADMEGSDTSDGLGENSKYLSNSTLLEQELDEGTETYGGQKQQVNCLAILSDRCTRWEWFTGYLVNNQRTPACKPTSNFGPIMSKCSSPGKYMFNRAMTFHSIVGATVKSICRGVIIKKTSSSVTTKHNFKTKCQFRGVKDITTFTIHYDNIQIPKKVNQPVYASEHFGKATECGKCEKKNDKNQHVLVMVEINKTFVNPMGLFPALRSNQAIDGGMESNGNYKIRARANCVDMTVNRFDVKCGSKRHVLDFNNRLGFHKSDIGRKPHNRSMSFPYMSPEKNMYEGQAWRTYLTIPKSFHGGNCCFVMMSDIWGRQKAYKNFCPKKALRG